MIIKLPGIEITVVLLTRKAQVRRKLNELGTIMTIKWYREKYKVGLNEAYAFVRPIFSAEEEKKQNANPNQ